MWAIAIPGIAMVAGLSSTSCTLRFYARPISPFLPFQGALTPFG
jgi:hypothetical protein